MGSLFLQGLGVIRKEGYSALVRKAFSYVLSRSVGHFLIFSVIRRFRYSVSIVVDVDGAVDFGFTFKHLGISIKPFQVREELKKLLKLIEELKPKVVLEIGTANGGSLFLFTRVADPRATIISIDIPGGSFGGGYPSWKIPLYKSFASSLQKIHLIMADSHKPQTSRQIKTILGDREIDFLFIDGDHSYNGVKTDFENYNSLVRKGGIIAFHDIVPGPAELVGGMPQFWSDVKERFDHQEIVKSWKQGGFGIGVIYI